MSQAPSAAFAGVNEDSTVDVAANVSLRGTTRGLEILISGTPSAAALGARLTELLAEAPGFFAGSHARVAIDGLLPVGALACLEEVAARFELRIVEIGPAAGRRSRLEVAGAPREIADSGRGESRPEKLAEKLAEKLPDKLADGTGPIADELVEPRRDDRGAAAQVEAALPMLPADAADSCAGAMATGASSSAVPRHALAGATASDPLVSAATALVSAAAALTTEPSSGSSPLPCAAIAEAAEAAGNAALMDTQADAAWKAALIEAEAAEAAGNPSLTDTVMDAACKAASLDGPVHAASNATLREAPTDAAGNVASTDTVAGEAHQAASTEAATDVACKAAAIEAPTDAVRNAASTTLTDDPGLAAALVAALDATAGTGAAAAVADGPVAPRLVIGPVRSGRIVDHVGHLIVIGDVNPGAEVRAEGSIIVLGRLRGVAHAAIGRDAGCIIALSLQPQQLRIGRMVARAGDADRPGGGAEIAYATGETIVVERFLGRLPGGLAASM